MSEFASIVEELRAASWGETGVAHASAAPAPPAPAPSGRARRHENKPFAMALQQLFGRLKAMTVPHLLQTRARRMRVSETVSLGDKRFISIVDVDGQSYLIGGGTGSVSLLTHLPAPDSAKASLPAAQLSHTSHREMVQ